MVVRMPAGPADDVVPAVRPITVIDSAHLPCGVRFSVDFFAAGVGLLSAS